MAHQAWNVSLNGKNIDTVFYDKGCDAEYVRTGLINHDGYDPEIKVRKARAKKPKTKKPMNTQEMITQNLYEALRKLLRHEYMLGGGCSVSDDLRHARMALAEYESANK